MRRIRPAHLYASNTFAVAGIGVGNTHNLGDRTLRGTVSDQKPGTGTLPGMELARWLLTRALYQQANDHLQAP